MKPTTEVDPEPSRKRTRGASVLKKESWRPANKRAIIALVERGGNVRTFHVPAADKDTVTKIVRENIGRESPTALGRKLTISRLGSGFCGA